MNTESILNEFDEITGQLSALKLFEVNNERLERLYIRFLTLMSNLVSIGFEPKDADASQLFELKERVDRSLNRKRIFNFLEARDFLIEQVKSEEKHFTKSIRFQQEVRRLAIA